MSKIVDRTQVADIVETVNIDEYGNTIKIKTDWFNYGQLKFETIKINDIPTWYTVLYRTENGVEKFKFKYEDVCQPVKISFENGNLCTTLKLKKSYN
jgi:hypothetical protein